MKRHVLISLAVIIAIALYCREAAAFWGSDTKETASGLNVTAGFDVNTVGTLTGTVVTAPERTGHEEQAVMTLSTLQGTVTIMLGPWWYWEQQTLSLVKGQEITVTGSRAQGKDGSRYLFAQRIENPASGETLTLRSDTGVPAWSRSASGSQTGIRQQGGAGASARGSGSRGGGSRGGSRR
ncbi:MAG: DNA-binding protein [Geobacteraceae bacterium]|nr:DNA-binding protein [Geobacteraceae bacterium]